MRTNITKEDIIVLRDELLKYAETAEQYEFPMIAMVHIKLNNSIEHYDEIGECDVEKNAMFRVAYRVMGRDFSEYE